MMQEMMPMSIINNIFIDLSSPDINENFSLAKSSSTSYQLTKTPRLVIVMQRNSGGNYYNYNSIANYVDGVGFSASIGNDLTSWSIHEGIEETEYMMIFDSSTNILTIKNDSTSYARRCYIRLWY